MIIKKINKTKDLFLIGKILAKLTKKKKIDEVKYIINESDIITNITEIQKIIR